MKLFLWNLYLFIPVLIVFLPLLTAECVRRNTGDAKKSGLLKMSLLLLPLTIAGMAAVIAVILLLNKLLCGRNFSLGFKQTVTGAFQTAAVFLTALAEQKLAKSLALKKGARIFAALLMLLLFIAEMMLFIMIASGCTT